MSASTTAGVARTRIIVSHRQLKGWNITPSHYVGQDLSDVWLDQ